jgi:hypothetical protein
MSKEDEFSQSFRRKILAEDRDRLASLLDHARASADDTAGGRFAAMGKPTVVGADPTLAVPRLPPDAPSNQLAMNSPQEPQLGYSVEDHEAVGEIFEQTTPSASASVEGEGGGPKEISAASPGLVTIKRFRRRL